MFDEPLVKQRSSTISKKPSGLSRLLKRDKGNTNVQFKSDMILEDKVQKSADKTVSKTQKITDFKKEKGKVQNLHLDLADSTLTTVK